MKTEANQGSSQSETLPHFLGHLRHHGKIFKFHNFCFWYFIMQIGLKITFCSWVDQQKVLFLSKNEENY